MTTFTLWFLFSAINADESIDLLIQKFPIVLAKFSDFDKPTKEVSAIWSRTDLLENFSINQLSQNEKLFLINTRPISFLSSDESRLPYPDYQNRIIKSPKVIYRWEFEIENDGLFLLNLPNEIGCKGFLNNEMVMIISHGVISKLNSGQQWIKLDKGKNLLCIATTPNSPNQLKIIPATSETLIKNEIISRLTSNKKDDYNWITNDFIPYLGTLKNGIHPFIINELERLNKNNPFTKTDETVVKLKNSIPTDFFDGYQVEKYIYSKFPDIYFYYSKFAESKNTNLNCFMFTNYELRLHFLQQLIFDGQKKLADTYFGQYLEILTHLSDFPKKEEYISSLYATQVKSMFWIGRIKDVNDNISVIKEKGKGFPLPLYVESPPLQEDNVTLTHSFDETKANEIKNNLEAYDGKSEKLTSIYKLFLNLGNQMIKKNDGAISHYHLFNKLKNTNEKLKNDFEKFCLEKIQSKIKIASERRDIKSIEEIIEQFEGITSFPDLHLILLEEYFNNGFFLKALSQAHLIFDKHPSLQAKIISKMVILEEIAEIPLDQRKEIPTDLQITEFKLKGSLTNINKFNTLSLKSQKKQKGLGQLVNAFALEPTHEQYWNHPQIETYQPIEPIFTQNNIIINGASYLMNYSISKNNVTWTYHSEEEYKKDNETGPHQKRFITEHAGNQLFAFTNRNHSKLKTIKSFDLKGHFLWDISDQKNSITEEPLCTPIEANGKLFGLSYSNHETINTINFCIYQPNTGEILKRTPISLLPEIGRGANARVIIPNWNSFTHDAHFVKDKDSIYGYSGSGVVFKADTNSGYLLWEKGFSKPSNGDENSYWFYFGSAPSGFIHIYDNTLLCFLPEIQMFTAINKQAGETIWKTNFYKPRFIHDRGKSNFLYFSSAQVKNEPVLFKVNPINGATIWQTPTNGLVISGEGDLLGDKLYIPSEKSILEFDANTGKLLNIISLNIQPLKIRCSWENTVILTSNSAFILQNDGILDTNLLKEANPITKAGKIYEPDAPPLKTLTFENLNLETTLKIPETYYTSSDPWKKSQVIKTSKPYHFLLSCKENLTLFREGYYQKEGMYIPPEVLWFGQYPWHDIFEDTLYISEYGKIIATNLFTREILWTYDYRCNSPVVKSSFYKTKPLISVTSKHIAFQTENETIRVIDSQTRQIVLEFYTPFISILKMEGNYIVTSNKTGPVRCYDISQNGKEIWTLLYDNIRDLYTENGLLIYVKPRECQIGFYDLKTGALKVQATCTNDLNHYIMNRWRLDDNILFAYNRLYDAKNGKPIEKYQSGALVNGGGFLGFYKQYGQEGNYMEGGKEYSFKTKGKFSNLNFLFSAIRKGNRITFFSFFFVETFEIINDSLISVDYSNINSGKVGIYADQGGMDLFTLENSLLEIRNDNMYFYRSFDPELNFEKIKSFRVENRRNFVWPTSELYPEIEVSEKNWISYFNQKPKHKLAYQAFGDENYAYLKFHLSPIQEKDVNNILYISADGILDKISIIWDINNWNNAQCSFNVNKNIETWKEIDFKGNIYLYFKMRLIDAFPNWCKNTLPNFNIELRQMTGQQSDGTFRIGGAYQGIPSQIPWLNYINDEAQTLRNFKLRTALYENQVNFYPQGIDLVIWLKDRRRFKSVEDNIIVLNKMLSLNTKFYCSVNILSSLLLEEVHKLKINNPELYDVSDEFSQKVFEIVSKLNQFALKQGMQKDWVDFALSFWTLEVFPYKFSYLANRHFTKPYYSMAINCGSTRLLKSNFLFEDNLLVSNINQPFIEWIMPGLIPHFPQLNNFNSIFIEDFIVQKAGLGKMEAYSPQGVKEFCNRKGIFTDPAYKFLKNDGTIILTKENFYFYKNQKYDCFTLNSSTPAHDITITFPLIKSPEQLKNTEQTVDSIMYTLKNLPTDKNNGLKIIDNYLTLRGKSGDDGEQINIYEKWLNNLRDNPLSCANALNSIYERNQTRKDIFSFMDKIIQTAKIPTNAPRMFYLNQRNIFSNKSSRSVLGPIFQELKIAPEVSFKFDSTYFTADRSYKFSESLEEKKGGSIYIASNILAQENQKAFLFTGAYNRNNAMYTSSSFSIWLNGKMLILNTTFQNYEDAIYTQKIILEKGNNILLIKINGIDNYDWGNHFSICVGNLFAAPIEGIEMKSLPK